MLMWTTADASCCCSGADCRVPTDFSDVRRVRNILLTSHKKTKLSNLMDQYRKQNTDCQAEYFATFVFPLI